MFRDVLVAPEEVVRVVLRLDGHEPVEVRAVGGANSVGLVVTEVVHVHRVRHPRPQCGVQLARPANVAFVVGGIVPLRQNETVPLVVTMRTFPRASRSFVLWWTSP